MKTTIWNIKAETIIKVVEENRTRTKTVITALKSPDPDYLVQIVARALPTEDNESSIYRVTIPSNASGGAFRFKIGTVFTDPVDYDAPSAMEVVLLGTGIIGSVTQTEVVPNLVYDLEIDNWPQPPVGLEIVQEPSSPMLVSAQTRLTEITASDLPDAGTLTLGRYQQSGINRTLVQYGPYTITQLGNSAFMNAEVKQKVNDGAAVYDISGFPEITINESPNTNLGEFFEIENTMTTTDWLSFTRSFSASNPDGGQYVIGFGGVNSPAINATDDKDQIETKLRTLPGFGSVSVQNDTPGVVLIVLFQVTDLVFADITLVSNTVVEGSSPSDVNFFERDAYEILPVTFTIDEVRPGNVETQILPTLELTQAGDNFFREVQNINAGGSLEIIGGTEINVLIDGQQGNPDFEADIRVDEYFQ
jgi:hypothetical protein